jgi:hypothetical protein
MALTIKFIRYAPRIVEVAEETLPIDDPEEAFEIAQRKLREEMRYKAQPAPDGFVILDAGGNELKRWIEKAG